MVDAQVHAYEANRPQRPWSGELPGPAAVTGDDMISAMRGAGVDKALLVSPWTLYRSDASYAVEVAAAHPDRFRVVVPVDPYEPNALNVLTSWLTDPLVVGVRLMAGLSPGFRSEHPQVEAVIRAAAARNLPVCVLRTSGLSLIDGLARRYPNTQFVLDHLGLDQRLTPPPPPDPFAELNAVLRLAQRPNIAVKVTGACTLSHQPYPFKDLWEPLARLFEAFGIDRCLWGTDWTRTMAFVGYADAVAAFRDHLPLADSDRSALMGGVAARIFGLDGGATP